MDEISIDRLVFNVPGLSPAAAKELAKKVGEGLSKQELPDGNHEMLSLDLSEQASAHDIPRLANEIVDALMRQLG